MTQKDKIVNSFILSNSKWEKKRDLGERRSSSCCRKLQWRFYTGDPTVDGLRDKKENCSTRIGLRVGTGFVSF